MGTVPYTSNEFIEVLEKNVAMYGKYEEGVRAMAEAEERMDSTMEETKTTLEEALGGAKQDFDDAVQELHDQVTALLGGKFVFPRITNEDSIVPTGTYATATYYDTAFGVRIAYGMSGDVYVIMKGGTTTAYEYLRFVAGTVPDGVTIETAVPESTSYVTAMPGMLMVGIIHGVSRNMEMSIVMSSYNASYDYTDVTITLTAA